MNIVVCIKRVPDIEGQIAVEKGALQERGLNFIVNPLDLVAVEETVRIKERVGGRVTLISLGSPAAEKTLCDGLALGADENILLCDLAFDSGDSYATALALARAIGLIQYDLILCGKRSDDTQAGQVGVQLGHMLDIPVVQGVVNIDPRPDTLLLQKKLEKGDREILECSLPALLTVDSGLNAPRYPALRSILQAKCRKPRTLDAGQLGLDKLQVGANGSKLKTVKIGPPKPKMKGLLIPDAKLSPAQRLRMISEGGMTQKKSDFVEGKPDEVAARLVDFLQQRRILSVQP